MASWDPTIPGVRVHLRDNPGRRGVTTGRVLPRGDRTLVEVQFSPNEVTFKPISTLEISAPARLLPLEALRLGQFGTPLDLARLLTFEKVRGRLTNVLYSMESSNTDFYPHQFKPVLKFLDSPDGRLLVADEVGLGKTIEAIYIWKELQARETAQRLLVVCPAMLQEKWRLDLLLRFNILGDVVSPSELKERLDAYSQLGNRLAFTLICSLEGLRPPAEWEDETNASTRAQLARLFDRTQPTELEALFDLVIIDEAHYLRNPATASHRLGRLLRDASRHLLLLTATPVQLHSDNLYQLLRLISPELFSSSLVFDSLLEANRPVMAAQRHLWSHPPQAAQAREEVERALASPFHAESPVLRAVSATLGTGDPLTEELRAQLGHQLETASLLSQYLARTRKRDVIAPRVERVPQVLVVRFNPIEQAIYEQITAQIRNRARGSKGMDVFVEIARQRRMASCLVAALGAWEEQGDLEELLWGDLGMARGLDQSAGSDEAVAEDASATQLKELVGSVDISALERQDSKYGELLGFLKSRLAQNPAEKFVAFAYFRGTLAYLRRRLQRDGISAAVIQGGMGEEKWDVIGAFREPAGPSVLLSSEVGSEGIDLQFARFLVNYDLPWNPMKVEQRIGRIDRLGQQAERIFIVNFALRDSIEDRVLQRLYDRIRIFKESVGDLEEILGRETERLLVELFTEDLSEEALQRRADQIALALANTRVNQDRLEENAINLLAFSDYIMAAITRSRDQGRWLQPIEVRRFVEDFVRMRYPGTVFVPQDGQREVYLLTLSDAAKGDFEAFLSRYEGVRRTGLHRAAEVRCFFDPKQAGVMGRRMELLDQTHPLVQWIRNCYEADDMYFHPVAAVVLDAAPLAIAAGPYVFTAQLWTFTGLRRESRIAYAATGVDEGRPLGSDMAERLVTVAAQLGVELANAAHRLEMPRILEVAEGCQGKLLDEYDEAAEAFRAENEMRCRVQEESARAFHARRAGELKTRIERFREQGKTSLIPPTEGLLRRVDQELEAKMGQIVTSRQVDDSMLPLAVGLIDVREGAR